MPQKTCKEIRNLKMRESKCWKVIDQHLRLDEKSECSAKVRQAAAEFVLKRLYPERHIVGGEGEGGAIPVVVSYLPEVKK